MDRWRPNAEENPRPRDGGEAGEEGQEPFDPELWLASQPEKGEELPEQTERLDPRPIIWDRANRQHLVDDHPERGVSLAEVEEALNDPERINKYDEARDSYRSLGRTEAGRWLVVAWVVIPEGRYPVHAHQAGRRALKRWHQ